MGRLTTLIDEPGHPFHGLTHEKAIIINQVFCGLRVELIGGERPWTGRQVYVFNRMRLPGEEAHIFAAAYDLVLLHYEADAERASCGSTRNISPILVDRLTVVDPVALSPCWQCGCWYPPHRLRDTSRWWTEDGHPLEARLECRGCAQY